MSGAQMPKRPYGVSETINPSHGFHILLNRHCRAFGLRCCEESRYNRDDEAIFPDINRLWNRNNPVLRLLRPDKPELEKAGFHAQKRY
jgi:hypothetical protein